MQISEKVTRLKSDFDGVYDRGYKSGMENSENYKSGYADGKQEGYTEGKVDGIEQGKQAEYEAFWDAYQENGNRDNYRLAFAGKGWTTENFKPKYDIRPRSNYHYMLFYESSLEGDLVEMLEECGVVLDFSNTAGWAQYVFSGSKLTRVGKCDFSGCNTIQSAFSGTPLHTIDELVVSATTGFSGVFNECAELQNLTISGTIGQSGLDLQWSTKLSKASIISVMNALSTTTSGLSIILPKTAVDREFEEGDRLGSDSQEWEEILQNHSNCTISLV